MESMLTPALYGLASLLIIAVFTYAKDWLTNRSVRLTLETVQLQTALAAQRIEETARMMEAQKETDRLQAEELKKIAALSVQTHEIVNSQRTQMREDMATQKAELDKVIAGLRADLRLAQVQASPTPPAIAPQDAQVTIPAVTVAVEAAEPARIVRP